MIEVLAELQDFVSLGLWHGIAVFLRVSAFVSMLPAFGEQSVPMRIKLVLGIAFTLIVAPAVPSHPAPADVSGLAAMALVEISVGLALGLMIRLFVFALQIAGTIAAQSTSLSQLLGTAGVEPTPALGHVLVISGITLAVLAGLHVRAAEFILQSYVIFPIGVPPSIAIMNEWAVSRVSHTFSLAFALAAPFVLASLIYNLTLGVINRAMPQLMVAFVGAPVVTFGGLAILLLGSPIILSTWLSSLTGFLSAPLGN